MRLATWVRYGRVRFGAVATDGLIDLTDRCGARVNSLRSLLVEDDASALRKLVDDSGVDHTLEDVDFLPVIPDPDKIFCVGLNYRKHAAEGGRDVPEFPTLFTRFANSQVGHGQPMIVPRASAKLDFEGELAVIIGQPARHVAEADALSVVAGYSCFNDGSVRDWQRRTSQFVAGKSFWHSGAFGPHLVTADEIDDPGSLDLTTRLNGEVMQSANTANLIFPVPHLISYCSTITELNPGDVIVTGTPEGVGCFRDPPIFLRPGDVVEVSISGIGTLRNPIAAEA